MRHRTALIFTLALAALAAVAMARAGDWPTKPIRVIVPLSPGSAADIIPRIVFEQVSAQLGQPIIVENKPGASGTIGARAVQMADPDGYTLLAHSSAHIIAPSTVANLSYDPIKDFAAVAPLGNLPNVLVIAPSANIKTLQELVAIGKQRPITFGSIGPGSPITLAMQRLRLSAGFKVQDIPFKGAPEALVEVMTGRVDTYYSPLLAALPYITSGKLLALAVSSPTRAPTIPDVPTTQEAGYANSAYRFWIGVFAPAKTPPAIVEKLNAEIQKAMQEPLVRAKLAKLGVQPMAMKTAEFEKFVKEELQINSELVKAAGIVPQ
ncbi:MAG TPA: tripartite tricarboxylate transporter substrate binding protein [Pseudolabrys sp.]|nr:tripartite tricarboxylate transporter substrate binding protein [Pseudolabrys sp.]